MCTGILGIISLPERSDANVFYMIVLRSVFLYSSAWLVNVTERSNVNLYFPPVSHTGSAKSVSVCIVIQCTSSSAPCSV